MATKNRQPLQRKVSRRDFLRLAGAGVATSALGGTISLANSQAAAQGHWDQETDVVVVGSGAAASSAAINAREAGASVIMLEKAPIPGGTTAKSGGCPWIPNNRFMREAGLKDPRDDAIRYMARYSYPQLYFADAPRYGLPEREYSLLAAYYDNASPALDSLLEQKIEYAALKGPDGEFVVDYFADAPENKAPRGRLVCPSGSGGGGTFIQQAQAAIKRQGTSVLLNHRVTRVVQNDKGEVVGVEATTNEGQTVAIRAHKAVIFGSGGYVQNKELLLLFQRGPIAGGCGVPTNTGDFVKIGNDAGARLGNMAGGWYGEIVLEQALEVASVPGIVWQPTGDSMFEVNITGKRVVSEKADYNDRTRVHFVWDVQRKMWPNRMLFMIYDARTADLFGGNYPIPERGSTAPYVMSGNTLEELTTGIRDRLNKLAPQIAGFQLDEDFLGNLKETFTRFNQFATTGIDEDFHRGQPTYEWNWYKTFWSVPNKDSLYPVNRYPNITMHPFSAEGPYYAIILGGGVLDTNGGPLVNDHAQVVDTNNKPIPGLYGAGNCIAAPTAGAYYGGGGTIGPAVTYGHIAGRNAAKEPEKAASLFSKASRAA